MLRDIYCHLVKMHLKTRHAHIITIDTDYTLHRELGNQYDGYEEMVHDLGERFVVIGEEVPAPAECMLMDTNCEADCCQELCDDTKILKTVIDSVDKVDRGTENILADICIEVGKFCANLQALCKRDCEEDEKEGEESYEKEKAMLKPTIKFIAR